MSVLMRIPPVGLIGPTGGFPGCDIRAEAQGCMSVLAAYGSGGTVRRRAKPPAAPREQRFVIVCFHGTPHFEARGERHRQHSRLHMTRAIHNGAVTGGVSRWVD